MRISIHEEQIIISLSILTPLFLSAQNAAQTTAALKNFNARLTKTRKRN